MIRVWRLGRLSDNPATNIFPTREMMIKFRNVLELVIKGEKDSGCADLVWGPDIDCLQIGGGNSDVVLMPVLDEATGETLYKLEKIS